MPVADHPVHASTVLDTAARKWCFNRPDFKPSYLAPGGLDQQRSLLFGPDRLTRVINALVCLVEVPFRMTHECRYDNAPNDPTCQGCRRINEGADYAKTQQPKA